MPEMALAPLKAERYKEYGSIGTNAQFVFDWEYLPEGAMMQWNMIDLIIQSKDEVNANEFSFIDIAAVWLPLYDADAAEAPSTRAAINTLINKRVPKIDPTSPLSDFSVSEDEYVLGNEDTNLMWQPGKITLKALTDPGKIGFLFHRRHRLGYAEGSAYRTNTAASSYPKVRLISRIQDMVTTGLKAPTPGIVAFFLTNPDTEADNTFEESSTVPLDNEFENLAFLVPRWDPILGTRTLASADLDAWRRWAVSYVVEQGASPRQWSQASLDLRCHRQVMFSRVVSSGNITEPEG